MFTKQQKHYMFLQGEGYATRITLFFSKVCIRYMNPMLVFVREFLCKKFQLHYVIYGGGYGDHKTPIFIVDLTL